MCTAETETKPAIHPPAELPQEVWGLWTGTDWLRAMDSVGDPRLMFFSEDDAIAGAESQDSTYGVPSMPVRII